MYKSFSGSKLILLLIFVLSLALLMSGFAFGVAENPSEDEKKIIEKSAKFLENVGNKSMAENIRTWIKNKKIKIDDELSEKTNGTTNKKSIIKLNDNFVKSLPKNELESFKRIASLASLLLHEKTHAHQAPEGGSLYENIKKGDWIASYDVDKECVGPDALEVQAYYKKLVAYLDWLEKIRDKEVSDDLSKDEKEKAEKLKKDKVSWLKSEAMSWALTLKKHNYEKSNKINLGYIHDEMKKINDNDSLSESEKVNKMQEKLNNAIKKLFDSGNFYDKMREIYKEKQGKKKTSKTIDPKKNQMTTVFFPDEKSNMTIMDLEPTVSLYSENNEELLNIEVYDFKIPPNPKPGYSYVSPVFDIRWNAAESINYELEIWMSGQNLENAELMAFGLERDSSEDWTILESNKVLLSENEGNIIGINDVATMVAVMVPKASYKDVPEGHWSYEATERLRYENILDNDVENIYPEMEVKREVFIKYLVKALNLELIEEAIPFEDVETSDPYFPYISTAYHNDLTQGVNKTTFGYEDVLTREQSITFLVRSQNMEKESNELSEESINSHLNSFSDSNTALSQWAKKYIVQAIKIGLTEGYPDNTIRGKKVLNNAEVITLIDRLITK